MLSCKDNSKGLPRPPGLLRVKLSTDSTFPLKCLKLLLEGNFTNKLAGFADQFCTWFYQSFLASRPNAFHVLFQTHFKVLVPFLKQYRPLYPPFSQYLKPHMELQWYLYFHQEYLGINSYEKHYPRAPTLQSMQYRPSLSEYTASI